MKRIPALLAVLLVPAFSSAANDSEFSISLGAFITDRDTDTRIDANISDSGTDIDLEDDLGFDKSDTVFRVDAYWRFARAHRLDASIFDLSRSATKVIEEDITIGDTVYPVAAEVGGDLNLDIYKLAYTWLFLTSEQAYLGATAGLYVADIGAEFSTSGGFDRESRDITAPLPVFGLRGEYRMTERWSLRGSAEVFAFEYGDFDGSLYDVFAGVDFSINNTVAVGLGVNSVRLDVSVQESDFTGDLDWSYEGVLVFLKLDF